MYDKIHYKLKKKAAREKQQITHKGIPIRITAKKKKKIILEWVAIPFSTGSSQPRDKTRVSCIAGRFFTVWATRKPKRLKRKKHNDLYLNITWSYIEKTPRNSLKKLEPITEFSKVVGYKWINKYHIYSYTLVNNPKAKFKKQSNLQ